jgi:aminotransferase
MVNYSKRVLSYGGSSIDFAAAVCRKFGSLSLAEGTPSIDTPGFLKKLACKYIVQSYNQYTANRGSKRLLNSIAQRWEKPLNRSISPFDEITVTCGATEALASAAFALIDNDDRVLVFEPFYENYKVITLLAGGIPIPINLMPFHWTPDWTTFEQEAATAKLLIMNSPHNPTGSILNWDILRKIAQIAIDNDLIVISDETYRWMSFTEEVNSIASLPGMCERTIVVGSFSKIFTITGWRVGFMIASEDISKHLRRTHDFLSICAPAPFQEAIAEALESPDFEPFLKELMGGYRHRRDILAEALKQAGMIFSLPDGAYYILADFKRIHPSFDDMDMAVHLAEHVGICGVPDRAFFMNPQRANRYIRFSFAKRNDQIDHAASKILKYYKGNS